MSFKKFLTESYRSPVAATILVLISPFVYSLFVNKDWIAVYSSIPQFIWVILLIILLLWFLTIIIRRKMSYHSGPFSVGAPYYGWRDLGELPYFNVIWKIRTPNPDPIPDPFDIRNKKLSIDVEYFPRCPNCKTKLEMSDNLYWYSWFCVGCGFNLKTWNTFDRVRHRAEKIAERELEIMEEQSDRQN